MDCRSSMSRIAFERLMRLFCVGGGSLGYLYNFEGGCDGTIKVRRG